MPKILEGKKNLAWLLDTDFHSVIISIVKEKTNVKNEQYQELFETALTGEGKMMKGFSNFHRYSLTNQLLAIMQMMGRGIPVSPIATYKKWAELGRQVTKGSKAIALIMPVTKKGDAGEKDSMFFILRNNWFAMSQTEGEDVVFPVIGFDFDKALLELNITRTAFATTEGNTQGYATKGRKLAINPIAQMPDKTFFHEVAHILLGHTEGESEFVESVETKHNLAEVEAESVALCCMLALGLEGIEYPRGYINHWLKGEQFPVESIKKIFKVADAILKAGQEKAEGKE